MMMIGSCLAWHLPSEKSISPGKMGSCISSEKRDMFAFFGQLQGREIKFDIIKWNFRTQAWCFAPGPAPNLLKPKMACQILAPLTYWVLLALSNVLTFHSPPLLTTTASSVSIQGVDCFSILFFPQEHWRWVPCGLILKVSKATFVN